MISVTTLAATPTPAWGNATSGFADMSGSGGVVLGLAAVILLLIVGLTMSARFYRMVLNASGALARSFEYAVKGVATTVVIGVFAAPFYLFAQHDGGTRGLVYRAVGLLIIGYAGLVVLGWVGERVWVRIARQHERVTGHRPLERFEEVETDD